MYMSRKKGALCNDTLLLGVLGVMQMRGIWQVNIFKSTYLLYFSFISAFSLNFFLFLFVFLSCAAALKGFAQML